MSKISSAGGGGTSLPATDATEIVKGSADATKKVRIEVDGITTGTTRVWTAPDADTNIPVAAQTITLSGLTAARTVTLPDANITVARSDAAQTFTGVQTFGSPPTSGQGAGSPKAEVWGASATGTGAEATALGASANTGSATGATAIGKSATATGNYTIAIGDAASAVPTEGVAIGTLSSVPSTGTGSMAVGYSSAANGPNATVIGNAATAGSSALQGSVVIGKSATATASNQFIVGSSASNGIAEVYIGSGVTAAAPTSVKYNATGGSGTDIAGANLTIAAGKSTGSAAPANVAIQSSVAGSTGTTLQTLADRDVIIGAAKTLTESSATAVVDISLASGAVIGGTLHYTIEANDGTDFQMIRGEATFSAVNKAGTITTAAGTPVEATAVSTGTLTNTFTVTTGASKITLNLNAVSSLTQTTLRAYRRVMLAGGASLVTPL